MVPDRALSHSIELRHDDSDEEYNSDRDGNEQPIKITNDGSSASEMTDSNSTFSESDQKSDASNDDLAIYASDEDVGDIKNVSFGALAKAQATFAPPTISRKRKFTAIETPPATAVDKPHPKHGTLSHKPKQDLTTRTSKHAPTVLSSRKPVSRKRQILSPPPSQKSRDPRFDPAITSRTLNANSIASAAKAYSFLNDYQASEILQLKSEIKKAEKSNPDQAIELQKQLMSMESRLRNTEFRNKEREVLRKHKIQEKQAIKEGKKNRPYFLKKSDVRKEIEKERVEGMGKKQRDTMEKRKRMREKRKEARDMPWARRTG